MTTENIDFCESTINCETICSTQQVLKKFLCVDINYMFINEEDFDFYDFLLQNLNLGNKDIYLNAFKIFNETVLEVVYNSCSEKTRLNMKHQKYIFYTVNTQSMSTFIRNMLASYDCITRDQLNILSEKVCERVKEILCKRYGMTIYNAIETVGKCLESLKTIDFFYHKLHSYESLMNSKVFVFCLTNEFLHSINFKIQIEKLKLLEKKIFFLKLNEFNENECDLLRILNNESVYDISKHVKHDYEGYITQRFLNDI